MGKNTGIKLLNTQLGHYEIGESFREGPNSAGGATVRGYVLNTGTKAIKYLYITFWPENAVGDTVGCEIRGTREGVVKITGPIEPHKPEELKAAKGFYQSYDKAEILWYNRSITTFALLEIEILYMDGTTETIAGKDVLWENVPWESLPGYGDGCYVATAVYGSYDCPQVWTLRRYRDNTLAKTWYGRAFIHTYYAVSPTLVKWFGHTDWFKNMWKPRLDRMVANLKAQGVEDTPYQDKNW